MGITDTQSYSLVIRDVLFDALAGDPYFANYTKRKTRMLAVQAQLLPYLGVYFMKEAMVPDGDANAGCIRFTHAVDIGFSVMIANNDQVAAELAANAGWWRIMQRLWPDQYIMNMINTYDPTTGTQNPDNTIIEAVTRGQVRPNYGMVNETPLVEMQYDISLSYRTNWPPVIVDDLLEIDVTTQVGDPPPDQRPPITSKYLFDISKRREKRR